MSILVNFGDTNSATNIRKVRTVSFLFNSGSERPKKAVEDAARASEREMYGKTL
jgi:hypothetical protein